MGGASRRSVIVGAVALTSTVLVVSTAEADIRLSEDDRINTVAGVEAPLGASVATGNLNGDPYEDLVLGNWLDNVSGENSAGSIAIVYGSEDGLDWTDVDVVHQDTPGISGAAEENDWFGEALAVANFDGDCCDDIAIGVKREDLESNTVRDTGWVHLLRGSPTGVIIDDELLQQEDPGGWPSTNEELDWFGGNLQPGDFDADGYDDLAVSVVEEDIGSGASAVEHAGAVILVFGTATGLDPSQYQVIIPDPLLEDGRYGYQMSAIPKSGGDQLVIASFQPDPTGAVFVYEGLDAGQPVPTPFEIGGAVVDAAPFSAARLGRGMQSGDFDADGEPDLLMSVWHDAPTEDREDAVAVLSGPISSSEVGSIEFLRLSEVVDSFVVGGDGPFLSFGSTSTVGDFDADGIDDAVFTVSDRSNGIGSPEERAFAFYGSSAGLGSFGTHEVPYRLYAVGSGDFDGDGYDAYVAGAYGDTLSSVLVRDGQFVPSRFSVGQVTNSWEHNGFVRMVVRREVLGDGPASITLTTRSDEAIAGEDFEPVTVTLEWAADETDPKYFDVPLILDGTIDRGERFEIEATDLSGATMFRTTTSVSIFDGDMEAVTPARVLETRPGQPTVDGESAGAGRIGAGQVIEVPIWGRGGIPEGASAVAVNSTVIGPSAAGFITLFACSDEVPNASALNYAPGAVVGNGAVVELSDEGSLCVFSRSATDLAIDVSGFVPGGSVVQATAPARLLETRSGQSTVDGEAEGEGPIDAGTSRQVQIAGRGGVPADATNVLLNLSAVFPTAPGFITIHDCDDDPPNGSNLNYAAGVVSGNGTLAPLGDDGTLCFFSRSATDLVVDITGHSTRSSFFQSTELSRLFDSRPGQETFDGEFAGTGRLEAGVPQRIEVETRSPVGNQAIGAFVNVTVVNPAATGHVRLYPCTDEVPLTSALNFRAGETKGNNAFVQLSEDGALCVFSIVDTDVVIDLLGKTILT